MEAVIGDLTEKKHPDQKYIISLQKNDSFGIREIYRLYAHKVQRMIVANSGTAADAADIFQESLLEIYKMAVDGKFTLTCPFEPFLILVCKRKWLNALKKKGRSPVTNYTDDLSAYKETEQQDAGLYATLVERESLIMELLDQLGDRCREVIKACMSNEHQEQVAASLGLTYAYLRKKKSECMSQLGKMAKLHPSFNP